LVKIIPEEGMGKTYDPAMHSAEHLLNQTMVRMFDCGRSVNAHIEKKKSRIDYRFDRNLTGEEIARVEERMNEAIGRDLTVREEFLDRDEAGTRFNLSKLPDDAGDRVRIVLIGDYDACPCIGPHVAATKAIGRFRILSTSHDNGLLRLRFTLDRLASPA
jgi:misacylated tRNA(Ala) deacylase